MHTKKPDLSLLSQNILDILNNNNIQDLLLFKKSLAKIRQNVLVNEYTDLLIKNFSHIKQYCRIGVIDSIVTKDVAR